MSTDSDIVFDVQTTFLAVSTIFEMFDNFFGQFFPEDTMHSSTGTEKYDARFDRDREQQLLTI